MMNYCACAMEDCDKTVRARGWCSMHWQRWYHTGDPLFVRRPGNKLGYRLAGDTVGYHGAHRRVRIERGPADDYLCVDCGSSARHWAYDHLDRVEKVDPRGRYYSLNTSHYSPMCAPCHKRFDLYVISTRKESA